MSNICHLVYSASLLDTFISDTTRFLFLLHPKAIGNDSVIKVSDVIAAESLEEVVSEIVAKRVRENGYQSFLDRIEYLKQKFALEVVIDESSKQSLNEFSTLRNVVIHDQGSHDTVLNSDGTVSIKSKSDSPHPTPVSDEDLRRAHQAFLSAAIAVYDSVVSKVMRHKEKTAMHKALTSIVEALTFRFDGKELPTNT